MTIIKRIKNKLKMKIDLFLKQLRHVNKNHNTIVVFLMGCQRSGTSMTSNIFNKDKNIRVYNEMKSSLNSEDRVTKIRLNSHKALKNTFANSNFPVVLAKPLVESQNALNYLENFETLKVIWLYRHYRDVAASNIKHFGIDNGKANLKPIYNRAKSNWRSENLSEEIVDFVHSFELDSLGSYDAAALFWWVRNKLFFDQNLQDQSKVLLCKYEDLVNSPLKSFQHLYNFIGITFTHPESTHIINAKAVGRGQEIKLNPTIQKACDKLYAKIESCNQFS